MLSAVSNFQRELIQLCTQAVLRPVALQASYCSQRNMASSAEADKLMKQAQKLCDPSFLSMRIKADWEQAQPLFEKAAKTYKVTGLAAVDTHFTAFLTD